MKGIGPIRGLLEIAAGGQVVASDFQYVIADDHPSVRLAVSHMLSELLELPPSAFATASSSADLLAMCGSAAAAPRIVILDLVMPGDLKRVGLVRALVRADPALRILVYTAEESAFLAQAVVDAGAAAYVAKTSPAAELTEALAAVRAGLQHVDSHIDLLRIKQHPWMSLTESEKAVLLALCRGTKAHQIVETTGRTYSTVTTHKYNALAKLGLRDGNDLLPYIYENGLLHELDFDPAGVAAQRRSERTA